MPDMEIEHDFIVAPKRRKNPAVNGTIRKLTEMLDNGGTYGRKI